MTIRIKINRSLCAKTGYCFDVCPEVFEPDENGVSQIREEYRAIAAIPGRSESGLGVGDVPDNLMDRLQDAANQCPVVAIEIG